MWVEAIEKRTSIRTYDIKPLDDKLKEKIIDYLNNIQGPFDQKVRFVMINIEESHSNKLGTYGVIKGAKNYIAAITNKKPRSMEQLGYILEKGILYATSLGLGTCWLAGTFKRQEFAKTVDLDGNEELPVITPVGYPRDKRSMLESFMRMAAGSKTRKDFKELFFDQQWDKPLDHKQPDKYVRALEMVRLSPSASNKQPWRVLVENNKFHFYLQRNKGYGESLGYDVQKIDIGIAMCHFEVAIQELGFKGKWVDVESQLQNIDSREYIVTFIIE